MAQEVFAYYSNDAYSAAGETAILGDGGKSLLLTHPYETSVYGEDGGVEQPSIPEDPFSTSSQPTLVGNGGEVSGVNDPLNVEAPEQYVTDRIVVGGVETNSYSILLFIVGIAVIYTLANPR